jgi:iron complex outermembrane receptor protein
VPYEVPAFPGRDFFRNAATSSRQGMEFSLSSTLTDNLSSVLTYTYSDFKFDDFPVFDSSGAVVENYAGNVIPGSAEDVLFGELTYAHPSGWFASIDVLYVSEQFANNTNSVAVDSYTVSNVRLGANLDLGRTQVSPFIGINNLTDETYFSNIRINAFGGRFYEPAPDRNFYAGVTIDFGR